jgi:hypothetical protein
LPDVPPSSWLLPWRAMNINLSFAKECQEEEKEGGVERDKNWMRGEELEEL